VTQSFKEGIENLYQWSLLVDQTFAKSMDKIATSMLYLKNSLGAMVSPILNALAPAIDLVVDKVVEGINMVNQFLAAITGSQTYTAARKVATEWAENETEKALKNVKELKKAILGFDELNILTRDTRSDTAKNGKKVPDYASMFENRPVENSIAEFARRVREAFESGEWGKIGNLFADKINQWVDGIDWESLGRKLGKGINKLVEFYVNFMEGIDWVNLGRSFAEGINGLLDEVDFVALGHALVAGVNALFETLYGLFDDLDWKLLGSKLVDLVWGAVDGLDWNSVADAMSTFINGAADALMVFADKFPWADVGVRLGKGINRLLDKIDYVDVANTLIALLDGALDSVWNFLDTVGSRAGRNGSRLEKGIMTFVNKFPAQKFAATLTKGIEVALDLALPTLTNPKFWEGIGTKLVTMFNTLFADKTLMEKVAKSIGAMVSGALTMADTILANISETDVAFALRAIVGEVFSEKNVSKMWELIKKAVAKGGDFIDALFMMDESTTDANSQYVKWFNQLSLGERIGIMLKKAFSSSMWSEVASFAWEKAREAFKTAGDILSVLFDVESGADSAQKAGEKIRKLLTEDIPWGKINDSLKKTIQGAITVGGSFINGLFSMSESETDFNSQYVKWFNQLPIGDRVAITIKKALGQDFWKTLGKDILKFAQMGIAEAGNFIAALLGISKTDVDNNGLGTEIGNKIKDVLTTKIPWTTIMSGVWNKVQSAFQTAGGIVNALLGDNTHIEYDSMLRMNRIVRDDRTLGEKLGSKIAEAIGKIEWGEGGIGGWLKKGATNLFEQFAGFVKGLSEDGSLANALSEFFGTFIDNKGEFFGKIGDSIKEILTSAGKTIGKAFGQAILDGAKVSLTEFFLGGELAYKVQNGTATGFDFVNALTGGMLGSIVDSFGITGDRSATEFNNHVASGLTGKAFSVDQIENAQTFDLFPWMHASAEEGPNLLQQAAEQSRGMNSGNQSSPIAKAVGDMLYGVSVTLDNYAKNVVPKKMEAINAAFSAGWNTGLSAIQISISQGMQNVVTLVLQPINNLVDIGVPGAAQRLQANLAATLTNVQTTVSQGVQGVVTLVLQPLNNLVDIGIAGIAQRLQGNVSSTLSSIQTTVSQGIQNVVTLVLQPMNNLSQIGVPGQMNTLSQAFSSGFYSISSGAAQAMTQMQSVVLQAVSNLESTIPGRFQSMYNGIVNMTNSLIGRVESAINSIINGLNSALQIHLTLDRPDWAGGGSWWWDWSASFPNITLGRVYALAKGGILDEPTMLAQDVLGGEAGREAILPLDNHTEWMDDVAGRVSEYMGYGADGNVYGDIGDHEDATDVSGIVNMLGMVIDRLDKIERKDTSVEVSTAQITKAQQRTNRRAGITVVPVGT
jgi:hypothetical protein